jgi:dimethylhistidine N-methyltransferase
MSITKPRSLTGADGAGAAERFRDDVLAGLRGPRKQLPCKYFYDETGSRLFDQITELPEYYLTRTELAIMERHAPAMAALLGTDCLLVEYGSGSSVKTRLLLDHLKRPAAYIPVDISGAHLRAAARALAKEYPAVKVLPVCADFTRPLNLPATDRLPSRRVVYFPGSTLGNFNPQEATALLRQTASLCGAGGALLMGVDLKKDPAILHAAYNDSQGVTAAFNLNLLARINRELGGNFRTGQFWHQAFYNPPEGRIEMHLVSRCDQRVHVGDVDIALVEGEAIETEYSYKYALAELDELARAAGFDVQATWVDDDRFFSVLYWVVKR